MAAPDAEAPRIAVLMTCHNRRALTLRCLAGLARQPEFREDALFLVDDGSTDGTGTAVRDAHPRAQVIAGDGSLFWNGGMRRAWQAAAGAGRFAFYLWLNDDVVLLPGALARLLGDAQGAASPAGEVVCAGATADPADPARITYGGHRRPAPRRRPLRMTLVPPGPAAQAVDTISGNIVLVSAAAFARLGSLDPAFTHIYGDLDYGLRARAAGVPVVLGAGVAGLCDDNPRTGTSDDPALSRLERLARRRREGRSLHAADWRRFAARHGGGPLARAGNRLMPYLRILLGRPHRHARPDH